MGGRGDGEEEWRREGDMRGGGGEERERGREVRQTGQRAPLQQVGRLKGIGVVPGRLLRLSPKLRGGPKRKRARGDSAGAGSIQGDTREERPREKRQDRKETHERRETCPALAERQETRHGEAAEKGEVSRSRVPRPFTVF